MEEQHHADDQSHYEISLTAGQAFVAFVLLLLSLAAAFAFGLVIGKGQADERLVVRKESPQVITEASLAPKKSEGRIVELGAEVPVDDDEFAEPAVDTAPVAETTAPTIVEEAPPAAAAPERAVAATETALAPAPAVVRVADHAPRVPHFAQLLSTSDQKTAESLAAKLIERGFTSAYVERGAATEKGAFYRVRVRFPSEGDARQAEPKLREFSTEVWITTR